MNIYKYILIGYLVMTIGYELAMHGKPKEGKYSFFWALVTIVPFIWLIVKS